MRLFVCFFLVLLSLSAAAAQPGAILFEGARLIVGDGSAPIENSAFLIENNRVSKIGRKGELQAPAGAVRINLNAKTVMPALIDAHTHLGWQVIKTNRIGADTYTRENLDDHLRRMAYYGVAARAFYGVQARNLARLNAAGVRIGFGTDSSAAVGWNAHQELTDMVAAGMTPAQVIVAANKTATAIVQLDQLGTMAAGKSADFIVLDANPLDNIDNTRRIAEVYQRGRKLDRAAMRAAFTGK